MTEADQRVPSWLVETEKAVTDASNVGRQQEQLVDLQDAARDLRAAHNGLRVAANAAKLGAGSWWGGMEADKDTLSLIESAQTDLGSRSVQRAAAAATKAASRARGAVADAWTAHVAAAAANALELPTLARALPGEKFNDMASRFDRAAQVLRRNPKDPPDQATVDALAQIVALRDELETSLRPAVRSFVSAAAGGGAYLHEMTDEVRTWLDAEGVAASFRIVTGAPSRRPDA